MADISDLDKNLAVREHLRWQLRQVEGRIQVLQKQQAEEARQRAAAAREESLWRLEPKGTGNTDYAILHRGGCPRGIRGKEVPRQWAVMALEETVIQCCGACNPEAKLRAGQ